MSDSATEAPTVKLTAKQLAEQALDMIGELRAELGQYRTELSEGRSSGGDGVQLAAMYAQRLDGFDNDLNGMTDALNQLGARLHAVEQGAGSVELTGIVEQIQALSAKTAESFKLMSATVDRQNTGVTAAVKDIRTELVALPALRNTVAELEEKVRLFGEAGVAPASAEDVTGLHGRLTHVEALAGELRSLLANPTEQPSVDHALAELDQRITETAQDLGNLKQYLDSPTFQAVERVADQLPTFVNTVVPRPAAVPMIYAQVHELMRLVSQIGKDSQADQKMGGYKFRSIEAAMDVVGHALREVGVMFQPRKIVDRRIERYEATNQYGKRVLYTHVWVTQEYAFVSLRDGSEMAAIEMDGEARDTGDKSTSKADSMRYKYALLQALCIPINGLPESDGRDGTEDGGQVHGRGDAGEAFDNATPARPQQAPERQETAYGYGHQPAESPGGQAHAQAASAPAQDTRSPEERASAAARALTAVLDLPPGQRREKYTKITDSIANQKLGSLRLPADGTNEPITLNRHAAIINAQIGVTG